MLRWFLAGYLFLLIFRPYEYWPFLGEWRIELLYTLSFIVAVTLDKHKRLIQSPIHIAAILFFISLFVSGLFGINWDTSSLFLEKYYKLYVFYFLMILSVKSEDDFRFLVVAFILVMLMYVSKSAWEFFINGRHVYRMGIPRMVGIDITYGDPNTFAATICYSLPLAWSLALCEFRNIWLRRSMSAYLLIALTAIVFTGSRSGFITTILFALIATLSSSKKVLGIILLSCICYTSWLVIPDNLQNRFLSAVDDDYAATEGAAVSAHGRLVGFLRGIELYQQNPILGIGPGTFPLSWPEIESGPQPHNLIGQLLGELGTVGAILFAYLLILIISTNMKTMKRCKLQPSTPTRILNCSSKTAQTQITNQAICNVPNLYNRTIRIAADDQQTGARTFHYLVARAIIQTIILMLFKGWGDHNLYRYTWFFLAALTILGEYFSRSEVKRHV